jgi:iron complex outermembrane receptor protein
LRPLIFLLLSLSPVFAQQHESVVVTGSFEPLSLDELDRAVLTLPVRNNTLFLNTLTDLLKLDPSIDLQERAPGGIQADVSIRGANFGQTLVLLNGQRLNDAQSGHHDMDIPVPLDSVERVEILRGSGSTVYGSDASGGVINIITQPPEGLEARLRTAFGSYGINQQRGSISDAFGSVSEQLAFSRDFSSGFMPDRDYRSLQFASITHARSALGNSDLTLCYMDHPFGADQFYGNYPSWEDTKTWFAGIRQEFGAHTEADFSYRRHSDLFVLFRDQPQIYTNHHTDESEVADLRRHESLSPTANLFYGVEALHESIVSNNLGNHARSRTAVYAAADFRALHRFSLTLSAREEAWRRWAFEFSPTVAGGVWLSQKVKLRASASRAFRVPSYTDLYYSDPANVGNPNLRPERAWNYEGGVDWAPAARVRATLTVFERRERDGIDFYRTSATDLWRALNIDSLNFTGVEAALRVSDFDVRYTALRGVQDTIAAAATKYTFNYPVQSAVVAWQRTLPSSIVFRTRLGILDRRSRDPYALWEISAARTSGKLHPFVQVSNLTATSYQEIQGVQMPGRTILGGLELLLKRR